MTTATTAVAGRVRPAARSQTQAPEQPMTVRSKRGGISCMGAKLVMTRINGRYHMVLPYPPSVNRMYRAINGRQILSHEGRLYKQRTASIAAGSKPFDGPVSVKLDVYRPAKRGDLDNTMKATLDALRGVAFHDDKQVVSIRAERFDDKADPRVEVTVELAEGTR